MTIFLGFIAFVAAQGLAVVGTAFLSLRFLKASHWLWKLPAMLVSYVAWVTFTITAYGLTGGDFGLMDGGGFLAILCFTCLVSSFFWFLVWAFLPDLLKADRQRVSPAS